MEKTKYGIWKKRFAYNSRNMFEGWLTDLGKPLLLYYETPRLCRGFKKALAMV